MGAFGNMFWIGALGIFTILTFCGLFVSNDSRNWGNVDSAYDESGDAPADGEEAYLARMRAQEFSRVEDEAAHWEPVKDDEDSEDR